MDKILIRAKRIYVILTHITFLTRRINFKPSMRAGLSDWVLSEVSVLVNYKFYLLNLNFAIFKIRWRSFDLITRRESIRVLVAMNFSNVAKSSEHI